MNVCVPIGIIWTNSFGFLSVGSVKIALSPQRIVSMSWSHVLSTCPWILMFTVQKINKTCSVQCRLRRVSRPLWRLRFTLRDSPTITISRWFSISAWPTISLYRIQQASATTDTWRTNRAEHQIAPLRTPTLRRLWWAVLHQSLVATHH